MHFFFLNPRDTLQQVVAQIAQIGYNDMFVFVY